jgi:hypothetical protein
MSHVLDLAWREGGRMTHGRCPEPGCGGESYDPLAGLCLDHYLYYYGGDPVEDGYESWNPHPPRYAPLADQVATEERDKARKGSRRD